MEANEKDESQVANQYNGIETIWDKDDKWHWYTKEQIRKFIKKCLPNQKLKDGFIIFNAGSGGNNYSIPDDYMIHLDIADRKIKEKKRYIVGSIKNIDMKDNSVDMIICVGSVLNYCSSATMAIKEFGRILKPGGSIILEYETTNSYEYKGTSSYQKSVVYNVETFYGGKAELLNMYSQNYINTILQFNGFKTKKTKRFHIFSPCHLKNKGITLEETNRAANMVRWDPIARFLTKNCSNIILLATKMG